MSYYFQTQNLTVGYDGNPLIRDITINVEKGEIVTLIGPNGAGKSTTMNERRAPEDSGMKSIGRRET